MSIENFLKATIGHELHHIKIIKEKGFDKYILNEIRTNRDTSLSLRFKVLKRDNFSCKFCGASPAKNSNVELQVDHIVPWSKGGKM